ncbi:hypothetical protein SanaruYs_35710 [Chryseotalea sanaruensis]|uniref:Fibronectin type-III domain-containing protein n=1 Tax=Chryseotalea sanaruensis TaxID=2482724 RepID=A0A401UEJ1_9BACT|nr:fibronectin type III domain-containing protein [Chryseotalea sanaruensis]GCC53328.1 hypothetical protein SanaruYs_35710 [Chryseotalea sanaruensis]
MSIPKHVLSFFSIVLSLSLKAQVFPVQGNVVLNPPYSPYMADLTALGSQRFWLTLRLQDPTINTYNCKLRLTIEGVGITIRTKNTFLPQPITLEGGGIPQFFYGDDLAAYFNPANLDFTGLTRSQYERTQRLPEGVYRFTIEVLDYNRGTLVSNKIGTTAWIVLNDPPILNLPGNDTKIAILEPTNIAFTWTPRHTGSPNAAFTTNYTFKMVELAPNATSQSANAAFLSQPVLYETTLSQNQLVYGPAEPTLMAGRKYAWQVQATDTEDRDLFRNNGKSEVFVFQYGDALGIPRNVLQQGGNATTLSMQWELPSEGEMPAQYRIRYKPLSSPANNYFESVTTNRYYTLGELNPSTNYLVQVRSERNSIFSEYSAPLQMSTTSLEDGPYTCGQAPVLTPPTTTEILPRLFPGDEIRMHDFRMMVLTVEGSNGYFSGTGLMPVSLFNNASVKVRFSGKVNKNHELAGEIVSTYAKGNAMGQLVEEMEKIGADRAAAQNNASETIAMPVAITIIGIIDSVWVQDSTIVVLKEDGTQEEIIRPVTASGAMQAVVLTDSEGNSYTINKEGEVINNGSSATSSVASTVHYKVNFSAQEDQDYGFDAKVHEVLNHYETTSIEGDTYTVPWKSVETGRFDKVKVTATVPRENLIQEVGFSADAASLPKQQGENASELIVTLQGKTHEQAEQISAYLNQENTADSTTNRLEVGKLNVISYNKAYKNLVLISVNGAQLPIQKETLQTELNNIYKQAIVQWQVEPVQTLTQIVYDTDSSGLEYGNSSWFSNYTGEMRTIINTYLQNRSLMPDTYYLFIVPKTDDPQVMGFMPRMKQMGFICSEKVTATNISKTIAHELAHGAFRLEHSFPLLPQNGDNLMDYSANGKNLYKTQWDYIHNPVAMLGLFDSDEEGAIKSLLTSEYVFMHDQLSTRAYASSLGTDEFTQDAVDYVDDKLYQLDTADLKTYIYFAYVWFHSGNIDRFDQIIENSFNHAIDSVKRHINEDNFNLLAIVNAKYDTALADGLKTVSFREKFYPVSGLKSECTKAVNDYLLSSAKKTFVNGLDAALKERADVLHENLKDCQIIVPEEIVIHYKRKGRNQYRTWGEFTIVGTDYKGFILERPKGDNPTKLEDCKRHPEGTYDIVYSTSVTGTEEKFWDVTMCLKEHTAYKLHGGTRVDNSDGCFLINYNSPQFDKYPESFQAKEEDVCKRPSKTRRSNPDKNKYTLANTYYQHYDENNPAFKLKQYIQTMETEIKEKYKIDQVVKRIIIDEQDEKTDL